jgi:hypothetical protein
MQPFSAFLPCLGLLLVSADPADVGGSYLYQPTEVELSYLYQPAFQIDYDLRQPAEPYIPQPGDIFLATGREFWAKLGHWMAGTGAPQHSGIVVARPNGRLVLLEAGPHNTLHCGSEEVISQLQSYAVMERVWIRQRKVPLTSEQSARLTAFAQATQAKRFALLRMFAQVTPLRCRGPLLAQGFGGPHGERWSYFCSELVAEACVAAGLLDPLTTRPEAMYPRDLFFGHSNCAFIKDHLDMSQWHPPARWTLRPGAEPPLGRSWPWLDGDGR